MGRRLSFRPRPPAPTGVPDRFRSCERCADLIRHTIALMDIDAANARQAARERVVADYDWTTNLTPFDTLLHGPTEARAKLSSLAPVAGARDAG